MGLLRREERANPLENPSVPLTSSTLLDWLTGPRVAAGVRVTEKGSPAIPAVYRAVALLSGSIASLPIHAYRRAGDLRLPAGERSQGTQLLLKPHEDLTWFEFCELVVVSLMLHGNFYARILRDELGRITELWPLNPAQVMAGRAKDGTKVYRVSGDTAPDGGPTPHTDDTIFHIPNMGYDGICGVSPVRAAREGLGLALAAEQTGAKLFGSGMLASGILQTEQRLTPTDAEALKERWKEKSAGLANAHEAVVLDRGAKFFPLTINPDDAQFLETRRFQVNEIARLFGVPPHLLGDVEKSTSWGTGIEQQNIGFVVWTLNGILGRIESRITSKLLQSETVYCKFDVKGLLRGDAQARAEFYRAMREIGAVNADDIRALEDLPPLPDGLGQLYLQPANLVPLGTKPQPAPSATRALLERLAALGSEEEPTEDMRELARALIDTHLEGATA
jgi:HK97 family phage portal protein